MDTNPLPQLQNDMYPACDGYQPPAPQDRPHNEEVAPVNEGPTLWSSALNILNSILLGDDYSQKPARLPTYSSTSQGVILVNTLVGSYGLRVWDPFEAILCSFTGTPSGSTFFKLAKSKFRKHQGHQVMILKATEGATQVFELVIDGIRFQIEYCQVAFTTESQIFDVLSAVSEDTYPSLTYAPYLTAKKHKSYATAAYLASHIPDMSIFQQSYRQIKEWTICQGIYSAQFLYLNESQLLLMVAAVCQTSTMTTVGEILQGFFDRYNSLDLRNEILCNKQVYYSQLANTGNPGKASNIAYLRLQLSDYTTQQNLQTIANCIHNTRSMIYSQGTSSIHKSLANCNGFADFTLQYETYIKVDISYWGPSQSTGARYVEHIESTVANWVKSMFPKNMPLDPAKPTSN